MVTKRRFRVDVTTCIWSTPPYPSTALNTDKRSGLKIWPSQSGWRSHTTRRNLYRKRRGAVRNISTRRHLLDVTYMTGLESNLCSLPGQNTTDHFAPHHRINSPRRVTTALQSTVFNWNTSVTDLKYIMVWLPPARALQRTVLATNSGFSFLQRRMHYRMVIEHRSYDSFL
jgi:hypothetical protein